MLIDSKKHFIVINKLDDPCYLSDSCFLDNIKYCLKVRFHGIQYIGICHDKDFNENNEHTRVHIHLYLQFPKKVTTQKIIREFSEYFGIDASNIISDMTVYSVNACVRYLLHLDDIDKYQYNENELFYSSQNMLELLNKDLDTLDIETLYDIVSSCSNLLQVYYRLGLNLSSRYRNVINDVWSYRKDLVNENNF